MIDANGRYLRGAGKASLNCGSQYVSVFKCPMVGTFNVRINFDVTKLTPSIVAFGGHHRYYLVRLNDAYYGWAVKWNGSRLPGAHLEILTKRRLPDALKTGAPLKVEVLEPWPPERVRAWAGKTHFFQTFDWTPPERRAANSSIIWDAISRNVDFSGADVLDIGANFGYHAFRASKAGASVVGQDKNQNVVDVARKINDFIESSDVVFVKEIPERAFDFIFYFSVHHQVNPDYSTLRETIQRLKERTRKLLFVELIVPPLRGSLTEKDIDNIVGGESLLTYRHVVRRTRRIYRIVGGR